MRSNTASFLRNLARRPMFLTAYSAFIASTLVGCGADVTAKPAEPISTNARAEFFLADHQRIESERSQRRLVDTDLNGIDEHSYIPVLEVPTKPNPKQADSDANARRFPGEFQQQSRQSRLSKQEFEAHDSDKGMAEDSDPVGAPLVNPSPAEKRSPVRQWTGRVPSAAPRVANPIAPRR